MLQALLHGKLSRQQENLEDILTSNVFGLLRYVSAIDGLFPLLSQSEDVDGSRPLSRLTDDEHGLSVSASDINFWPSFNEPNCRPCEPDVVIRVQNTQGSDLLILVEAKHLSGKSSEATEGSQPPDDQLAKEWDNLVSISSRVNAEPHLIFLTSNIGIPKNEILISIKEYQGKRPNDPKNPSILSLSWRHIYEVFRHSDEEILKDLCLLMKRLGLVYYYGLGKLSLPQKASWKFNILPDQWVGADMPKLTGWGFNNFPRKWFNQLPSGKFTWEFKTK